MLDAGDIKYTFIDTPSQLGLLDTITNDALENMHLHVVLIQLSVWEMSCCALPLPSKIIVPGTCLMELNIHIQEPTIS
jgi:hypothetical protein